MVLLVGPALRGSHVVAGTGKVRFLEILGLVLNPFNRILQPMRMAL
ncbi:hypothetical protein [Desulfofundulus thermosubterraneus]|nr:hypothetical protein [Desulfofundulus thermosubterraneus]